MTNPPKSDHPLYDTWIGIQARCDTNRDSTNHRMKHWANKGISVCDAWKADFWCFVVDMGPKPLDGQRYTIERKDSSGDYCKDNCFWATYQTQNRNRSNVLKLTVDGVTRSVPDWADETGIGAGRIKRRFKLMSARGYTMRQVVGLDEVPYTTGRRPAN